jgi:type IV pilus assembly protein PilA
MPPAVHTCGLPMRNSGFTLIEIMIVIGIIAILSLMAIPVYQDRFIRNQIGDALPLAEIAKGPIATSWAIARAFPADNASVGLPVPEKVVNNYISALAVENGAIHITFGNRASNAIKGKILTVRPAIVVDAPVVPVAWVCGLAKVPGNMTAQGENRTNIPIGYLPGLCRG